MVAPTTFIEIQLQLQEVPVLPNKPIYKSENAPRQRVNIDGKVREYYPSLKPERMQRFLTESAAYHHQKMCNTEKVRLLINRVINTIGTHIENEVYATPEEMECLAELKGKIQNIGMEFDPTEQTDEEFQAKLTQLKRSVEGIQNLVKALHRNLHDETYPLDRRIDMLVNAWDIQPNCAIVERDLRGLQENELKKLVRDVDNADPYSITRYNVRDRMVRINEISKTLQRVRDSHPVDPEKPMRDQIRTAHAEHVNWERSKAMVKSYVYWPLKLIGNAFYDHTKISVAATIGLLAYLQIPIPYVGPLIQAVKTPETYRPVVDFLSAVWSMGNFTKP